MTSTITATITPFFRWVPGSNPTAPPSTLYVKIESGAYGGGEDGGDQPSFPVYANNGFGDGPQPWWVDYDAALDALSIGSHLMSKDPQGQTLICLPPQTLSAAGGWANDWWNISTTVDYEAIVDNYVVTLSRDGARGETQDPDGTKHGDTIYSYGDYIVTEDFGNQKRTDYLNWQTFHPNFIGIWTFPQGSSPYWAWAPSESDNTSDSGKVSMHYRNYYTQEGEPAGTSDAPETRTVSYSVTDPLGATATANYLLTVHDPYERYIDNHRLLRENIARREGASSFTSEPSATSGSVYLEIAQSWGASASFDTFGELICPGLGVGIGADYSESISQGVTANTVPLTPGYTVWALTYDECDEYYGTLKVWDAGGYVGTQPYDEKIPNGHVGIQVSDPTWTGTGPDPGDPYSS